MNVDELRRWEDFGGTWSVLRRTGEEALLSLRRCDGGEEVEQLLVRDVDVLDYLDRAVPPDSRVRHLREVTQDDGNA